MEKSQQGQGCGYEGKRGALVMTEPCRIFRASTSFQVRILSHSFAVFLAGAGRGVWTLVSFLTTALGPTVTSDGNFKNDEGQKFNL